MIHVTGFILCPTMADADALSHLVADHLAATRAEPGCVHADILRSQEDPMRFAVALIFRDRAAHRAHVARTAVTAWGATTATLADELAVTSEPEAGPPGSGSALNCGL